MTEEQSEDITVESLVIPISTLTRWFLYDSGLGNSSSLTKALNLFPISTEGDEMEAADSARRVARVAPFAGLTRFISAVNAKVLREIQEEHLRETHPEHAENLESEGAEMEEMYSRISFVAVHTALSFALELGILVNPRTSTGLVGVSEAKQ